MLYTVVPLERIYSYRTESLLGNTQSGYEEIEEENKTVSLPYGKVYTRKNGKNYIVEGISSTDMNDYLNPMYAPGTTIDVSTLE